MKAMIMAAGRGERLRPLTDTVPKPMLEVGGRPLIEHQLGWLVSAGIRDVVVNLHYLGDAIENHVGDGAAFGARVRYSRESRLLETGGGIVNALPLLGDAPFLVVNGDNWIELDFAAADFSLAPRQLARLVVTPTPSFRSQGDFDLDGDTITRRGNGYVYCSVGVHDPALFAGLRVHPFSLRDLWFEQLSRGTIGAIRYHGFWSDIGTPEQLDAVRRRVAG